MPPLNKHTLEFLIQLEAARLRAEDSGDPDDAWVEVTGSKYPYIGMTRFKCVERDGDLYCITAIGQELMHQHDPNLPDSNIITLNGHSKAVVAAPPTQIVAPSSDNCISCADCTYKQALEILATRMPEAAELVAALSKINRRLS